MAAEIVVIVKDENARHADGTAEEPGRRKATDTAADHDEIVAFFDLAEAIASAAAGDLMGGLERAGMLAAQPGQGGRIAGGLGRDLLGRRQPRRDRQSHAVEEVAS